MYGNGVFRKAYGGRKTFRVPKIAENMHFVTTKCIVTLKCIRDVLSHRLLYIGAPVVLALHACATFSATFVFYIAELQLCYKDVFVQYK